MKRWAWIAAAAAVCGVGFFMMRPRPVVVECGHPETRTVQEYIAEEAKTRLDLEYLVDMPVSGTLERIAWEEGDEVAAGEVLARVNTYDLEQQIRGIEARIAQVRAQITGVDISKPKIEDLDTASVRVDELSDALRIAQKEQNIAEIELANAQKDWNRVKQLRADGVASQSEYDQAERQIKALEQNAGRARLAVQAAAKNKEIAELAHKRVTGSVDDNEYMRKAYQAEIESLEAQRGILRNDLEKSVVRAPVAGPVLEKYVDSERVLMAGTPLLKMGDLASMEIECDVLSEEVVRVQPGQPVEIYGKALGTDSAFPGKVKRIYPSAFVKISSLGIEQQRVKTIISFDNGTLKLRPGTRLDVRIITAAHENALAVPERSTFRRDGQWYAFKVEDGRARLAPIVAGLRNDEWAEITHGLSTDDIIIIEPKNELEEGVRIAAKH